MRSNSEGKRRDRERTEGSGLVGRKGKAIQLLLLLLLLAKGPKMRAKVSWAAVLV